MTAYVRNQDGKPLMPTRRCGHVRKLLRDGNKHRANKYTTIKQNTGLVFL